MEIWGTYWTLCPMHFWREYNGNNSQNLLIICIKHGQWWMLSILGKQLQNIKWKKALIPRYSVIAVNQMLTRVHQVWNINFLFLTVNVLWIKYKFKSNIERERERMNGQISQKHHKLCTSILWSHYISSKYILKKISAIPPSSPLRNGNGRFTRVVCWSLWKLASSNNQ